MWPFGPSTSKTSGIDASIPNNQRPEPETNFHPSDLDDLPPSPSPKVDNEDDENYETPDFKSLYDVFDYKTRTVFRVPFPYTGNYDERLSIVPTWRFRIVATMAFFTGFGFGGGAGGRLAADRYRAENAHRFPTTQAGWYLYHRTKSYNTAVQGARTGVKAGTILACWAYGFVNMEEGVDQLRGRLFRDSDWEEDKKKPPAQRDFLSTLVASMACAGAYSRVQRMDHFATLKTAKMGLRVGLGYGLLQDLVTTLRGDAPTYVKWIKGKVGWGSAEQGVVPV